MSGIRTLPFHFFGRSNKNSNSNQQLCSPPGSGGEVRLNSMILPSRYELILYGILIPIQDIYCPVCVYLRY